MKHEKTYEEKIADIKQYLKEKEEEMEKNKLTDIRKNPSSFMKTARGSYQESHLAKDEEIIDSRVYNNTIFNESEKQSLQSVEKEENNLDNVDINETIELEKYGDNTGEKKNKSTINILLTGLLILLPIFTSLSVISFHTTYLVRKPINYVMMIITFALLVSIIVLKIVKINKKDDKNRCMLKQFITILLIGILDLLFLVLFIKNQMWNLLDKVIENKFIFIFFIIVVLFALGLIILIRKKKKKKLKPGMRKIISTGVMTLYMLCYFDVLVVLYGPSNTFKEWIITTAMQTMNHQYLCKWFYSNEEINYILSQNYVLESGESTNPDLIDVKKEKIVYENEYEEAVLKRDNPDDPYKIINFEVNGCKAYLAVIYDPTTVKVATTNRLGVYGQYVTSMAKDHNAILAINGGGFYDPGNSSAGGTPTGITIVDGKIVTNGEYGTDVQSGGIIGFDDKGVLYLLKNKTAQEAINMGITNAVSWGPFLIVNGEPSFIKGNGGWGYAARTAIGQREDGIVLFLVVDSNATRTNGADMVDLTEIMQNYGAINAANLDGGTSSVMVLPKKAAVKYRSDCTDEYCYINDPIDGGLYHSTRAIADSFIVVKK